MDWKAFETFQSLRSVKRALRFRLTLFSGDRIILF
uniref:Uncharacterized protein n=1 Tax=Rhizophora mucronata TaxID=61149 RepID=A0A2P2MGN8_RHIMU